MTGLTSWQFLSRSRLLSRTVDTARHQGNIRIDELDRLLDGFTLFRHHQIHSRIAENCDDTPGMRRGATALGLRALTERRDTYGEDFGVIRTWAFFQVGCRELGIGGATRKRRLEREHP